MVTYFISVLKWLLINMANTKAAKIMIPTGQLALIQKWVDVGNYASVAAFCNEAISHYINYQKELNSKFEKGEDRVAESHNDGETGTGKT